ncbi:MAG: hypothetical protein HC780_23685 [Leptolyngbyaceae cyanobacterium CSU_1_3]|nr:hypothetical protein [Leptolyngbyaceae cyanobacterium CSU_1_3]
MHSSVRVGWEATRLPTLIRFAPSREDKRARLDSANDERHRERNKPSTFMPWYSLRRGSSAIPLTR